MKKQILLIALLAAGGISAVSCTKNDESQSVPKQRTDIELTKSQSELATIGNVFALDFLREISSIDKENENVFLSPLSAQMAFSMASAGAVGETQRQMREALGMGDYSQDEIDEYYAKIVPALLDVDNTTKIAIANSVWLRNDFSVNKSYAGILQNKYLAEGHALNADLSKAVTEINHWCSDNTNGLVDQIIETVPKNTAMMLINALYFKGTWSNKFDKSKNYDDNFYNADGTKAKVEYMYRQFESTVWYDDEAAAISLPYGNGAYRMTIVMPSEGGSVDKLLADADRSKWNNWVAGNGYYDVKLSLPKFNAEYSTGDNIVGALKQLGMELPFEAGSADFSGINSDADLFIGMANQKAVIKVDESGTEAAAVTVVGSLETSVGPTSAKEFVFKVDSPYLYFISEVSTGAILFTGKQAKF